MTPQAADALVRLSHLLTYPGDGYGDSLEALVASLETRHPDAACDLATFAARIGRSTGDGARSGAGRSGAPRAQRAWRGAGGPALTSNDLQELFTRTFDLNPVCALEVGWHLFGEEYERGAFLVRMRQALREHGIDEGGELPDHLASMLLLVTRIDADEADLLIANGLLPAIDKMLDPLEKSESPFLPLVKAVRQVLVTCPAGCKGPRQERNAHRTDRERTQNEHGRTGSAERSGAMGSPRANAPAGVQGAPAMMSKERSGATGSPRATRLAGCRGPRHSNEAIHG